MMAPQFTLYYRDYCSLCHAMRDALKPYVAAGQLALEIVDVDADEALVARILNAVVKAVPHTPVTLKFRTGWNKANKNAATIARIAEESGIQLIAIHGRTRACQYTGERHSLSRLCTCQRRCNHRRWLARCPACTT